MSDGKIGLILRSRSANQDDAEDKNVDLGHGGAFLQVIRPELDVEVRQLSEGAFTFLMACENGLMLGEAYEVAVSREAQLDLTKMLSDFLLGGTFIEATINGK